MFARLSRATVLCLIALPISASAFVERSLTIKGQLQSLEKEFAIVKTDSGSVNVPVDSIRRDGFRPGQTVIVHVDVVDLLELNKKFFDSISKAADKK